MWLRLALKLFIALFVISACSPATDRQAVDKLNSFSYAYHYRNLDSTEYYARKALLLSQDYESGYAEALNNLAFVKMVRMDYEAAMRLLDTIPEITDNHIELLVSYVQQMRLCQRMSRNRAFYDYREQAIRSLQRLNEERDLLPERLRMRLMYAESEMAIVTSTYYYYVGLERQSIEALDEIPAEIEKDTAQYLNYLYNVGAGGILTQGTQESINQQEFDFLMRCFLMARQLNYPFFAANAMEALAEHLIIPEYRERLIADNLPAMKYINPEGVSDDMLPLWLADNALATFLEYGDTYQIAGAYRTMASCYHADGDDESALFNLELALSDELVNQAPDLVASIRDKLSVAYAAMDDKLQSDRNRNIFLDMQEKTRQDRSLEARAGQLDEAVVQLNKLLVAVVVLVGLFVLLLLLFSYWHWRQQKSEGDKHDVSDEQEELKEQLALSMLHIANGQRKAVDGRAKVSLVNSITPFIDRMLHEIKRMGSDGRQETSVAQHLEYITELAEKIEEQNDILTHWIQLQKGELNLHIESFGLQPLFDIVAKGRMSFKLKGVTLNVEPTEATVKADRILTLFMLNTLADNARKFTEAGGTVSISAKETDGYVEVSVCDTGAGMSDEQLSRLFSNAQPTVLHASVSSSPASHGFGLLNCKGIIDKYRKLSQLFSVCMLSAESRLGQGSRFFFRLPKGLVRLAFLLLVSTANASTVNDALPLAKAYADSAYFSNIRGDYQLALSFADSCRACLNNYYLSLRPGRSDTLLAMGELSVTSPEVLWLHDSIPLNYGIIIDMRNESAIASLALHRWDLYGYNNRIYTQLFKEFTADSTLDDYCRKMQQSQANKTIAVILLFMVLLAIIVAIAYQLILSFRHSAMRESKQQEQLELLRDELHKAQLEEANLHVSNSVLDNCLSALKHETMYYPSRILQLVERGEVQAMPEVASYYRELYGLLSMQAMRQAEGCRLHLKPLAHEILGDETLVGYLFELLRKQSGNRKLEAQYHPYDQHFIEVRVPMPALQLSADEAAHLFEPRQDHIPYMLCRQIVREHGEAIHRSDFGIKAVIAEHNGKKETVIIMKLPRQICRNSK